MNVGKKYLGDRVGRMAFNSTVIQKAFSRKAVMNIELCYNSKNTGYINILTFVSNFKFINFRCYHYNHGKNRSCQNFNDVNIFSRIAKLGLHSSCVKEDDSSIITSNCLKNIQNTFKCSFEEAYVLMKKNKTLLFSKNELSLEKVKIYEEHGFSSNIIKENISILQYSKNDINKRINQLEKWNFKDINSGVKFLNLHFHELLSLTTFVLLDFNFLNNKNRIEYFADNIQCEVSEASELFFKHKFLFKMNLQRFLKILHLLLDAGIVPKNLLTDIYAFKYTPEWIASKINKVKSLDGFDEKATTLKPWMLRCLTPVIERTLQLQLMNKEATLPYSTETEYLCKALNISMLEMDSMIRRHSPLGKVNAYKLKQIIEFLKREGFSLTLVYYSPRILCHKLATLEERLHILRSLDYEVTDFRVLCKNRKPFDKFVERIKQSKNMKNEECAVNNSDSTSESERT